jgi:hypothetical protein
MRPHVCRCVAQGEESRAAAHHASLVHSQTLSAGTQAARSTVHLGANAVPRDKLPLNAHVHQLESLALVRPQPISNARIAARAIANFVLYPGTLAQRERHAYVSLKAGARLLTLPYRKREREPQAAWCAHNVSGWRVREVGGLLQKPCMSMTWHAGKLGARGRTQRLRQPCVDRHCSSAGQGS